MTVDLFGRVMSKPNSRDIIERVSMIGDEGLQRKLWECRFFFKKLKKNDKCKEPPKVIDICQTLTSVSQFLHTPLRVISSHFPSQHLEEVGDRAVLDESLHNSTTCQQSKGEKKPPHTLTVPQVVGVRKTTDLLVESPIHTVHAEVAHSLLVPHHQSSAPRHHGQRGSQSHCGSGIGPTKSKKTFGQGRR